MLVTIATILKELLFIVFTVAIPIVVKYGISYLKTLQINTSSGTLTGYIRNALEVIESIVVSVNQTYVNSLKASGEFTEEAQAEAFEKAKTLAVSLISEEMKAAIETLYGDFESFVTTQIEAAVNKEKYYNS